MQITAHRGSSMNAPENTMSAINLAIQEQADYVEGDYCVFHWDKHCSSSI
ncbi:MAG: hypothetical protein F6K47_10810 [Symploca sp. SIO2E6]|nr:hypothetical protein [Symploca sp. SIO2E6]